MPVTQPKDETCPAASAETPEVALESSVRKSTAGSLLELGITFALAASRNPTIGLCCRCRGPRNPQRSTAGNPNVFCSARCEQNFVRAALSSVTLDDCIRIQQRLETLLTGASQSVCELRA
jgi:hypothetical protein